MSLAAHLPSRTEIRTVARAMGAASRSRIERPGSRGRDDALVELGSDPFVGVDDTYERLAKMEQLLRRRGDRRSVFLTVYVRMTEAVREGLDTVDFHDPAWVRDYLVTFANEYRQALVRYERGEPEDIPRPWQIAFDASLGPHTVLLQDALLGISAHINYDLAFALEQVQIDPRRAQKYDDHRRINGILRRLTDEAQRALAEVYDDSTVAALDEMFGALDEVVTLAGLREARAFAWDNAVLLTDVESSWIRSVVRARIGLVATAAAWLILSPPVRRSTARSLDRAEPEGPPIDRFRDAFHRRTAARGDRRRVA